MILLKEDGSLDIDFINKLPFKDREEIISVMTEREWQYYWENTPKVNSPIEAIPVEDDEVELGWGIDSNKLLKQLRRKLKL